MTKYDMLTERIVYSRAPGTAENEEARVQGDYDRQFYCADLDQRWDYSVTLMHYIAHIMRHQIGGGTLSDEQKSGSEYLIEMAVHAVDDDILHVRPETQNGRAAYGRSVNLINRIIEANWADSFRTALVKRDADVNLGDGYQETLAALISLHDKPAEFFTWEKTRDIVADPTIVSPDNLLDHDEQRIRYGISTYDMQSPRAFISWLTLNAALDYCRPDLYTMPAGYDIETGATDYRRDLIDFAISLYVFGFSANPHDEVGLAAATNYMKFVSALSE